MQRGEEPCLHFRHIFQLVPLRGPQIKRFLNQVAGFGFVPAQAQSEPIERRMVLVHQLFKIKVAAHPVLVGMRLGNGFGSRQFCTLARRGIAGATI